MKSRRSQVNLQFWVDRTFRDQFVQTAKQNGFARWQHFAEILFQSAIAGDIRVSPPVLIQGGRRDE